MKDDYEPRLSLTLSQDQARRLQQLLPWGFKAPLFRAIVSDVIELLEQGKINIIQGIIERKFQSSEVLPSLGAEDEGSGNED